MTTKELEYFLSVYTTHSIKKSAEKLFISSQALSKVIKKLESECKVTLFVRETKGLIPTHSAHQLAEHAHRILNEFDSIYSDFNNSNSNKKTILTIAATYGVLCFLGYDFIKQFYHQYPQIQLNLIEAPEKQIYELLCSNEIEIAFLPAPIDYSLYNASFCFSWKHCLIIHRNHPLASKKTIQYSDLDGIPLVLKGRSYSVFPSNISRFLKEGVQPNILLETTSEYLINEVANQNEGVGVSLSFMAERLHSSNTVIREFDDPNCTKDVYLISKKSINISKESIYFTEFLNDWITEYNLRK